MDLTVDWPAGPHLVPHIEIVELAGFEEVQVEPCLSAAYAYLDVEREGAATSPLAILSTAQRAAAEALPERWAELEATLTDAAPPGTIWTVLTVTNRVHEGHAVLGFRGIVERDGGDQAVAAWVAGGAVLPVGADGSAPGVPDPTPPRPRTRAFTAQQALDLARAGDWATLRTHLTGGGEAVRPIVTQLVLHVARIPGEAWRELLPHVAALARATGDSHDHFRPSLLGEDRPEVLRALHDAGLVVLRPELLHEVGKPFELDRLAALGLDLNAPLGDDPRHTPLVTHRDHPGCFARLLALGADTSVLEDGAGGVRFALGPSQRAALRRHRPDLHVPEPEASLHREPDEG